MNDMSNFLGKVKFDKEQTSSGSGHNAVVIPMVKKSRQNRQQIPDTAQSHLSANPGPNSPQVKTEFIPVHSRALLVEKNVEERHAWRQVLLQSADFCVDVIEAANGAEALNLAVHQNFDCILLGYQLPDMSAMEFLSRLTELRDGLYQPVLKLIAPEKTGLLEEAIDGGEHDFLIMDNDGHYLKLLPIMFHGILEHHSLWHEKQQLEAMYRGLIEHIPAVTYIASPRNENRLLYISPQIERLGYHGDSWLSDPNMRFQCIYEEDRAAVKQAFANCCASGEIFRCKYRILSGSGKLHWFLDEARAIKSHNGQAGVFQGVMLDITEMTLMETELQAHRYFLEQRVKDHTEHLAKRIAILESCNNELCNLLDKAHITCNELRKLANQAPPGGYPLWRGRQ